MSATSIGSRLSAGLADGPSPRRRGDARRIASSSSSMRWLAWRRNASRRLVVPVDGPGAASDSSTARLTMVSSTVSRSRVELTAWLTSPRAWSSPTERVSACVRAPALEEADVLDGDDGLVGEGLQQLDLRVRERPRLGPSDADRADRLAVPQHRGRQEAPEAHRPAGLREPVGGILEHVRDLHDRAGQDRPAGGRPSSAGIG